MKASAFGREFVDAIKHMVVCECRHERGLHLQEPNFLMTGPCAYCKGACPDWRPSTKVTSPKKNS